MATKLYDKVETEDLFELRKGFSSMRKSIIVLSITYDENEFWAGHPGYWDWEDMLDMAPDEDVTVVIDDRATKDEYKKVIEDIENILLKEDSSQYKTRRSK